MQTLVFYEATGVAGRKGGRTLAKLWGEAVRNLPSLRPHLASRAGSPLASACPYTAGTQPKYHYTAPPPAQLALQVAADKMKGEQGALEVCC